MTLPARAAARGGGGAGTVGASGSGGRDGGADATAARDGGADGFKTFEPEPDGCGCGMADGAPGAAPLLFGVGLALAAGSRRRKR